MESKPDTQPSKEEANDGDMVLERGKDEEQIKKE